MSRARPYLLGLAFGLALAGTFMLGQAVAAPSAATGCFPDTNGHWAETFICWLKDNGISSGYPDGTYRPNNNVTRAEMSVFVNKSAALVRGTGTQFDSDGVFVMPGAVSPGFSGQFAQVTITAPGAGALLINGSLNLFCTIDLIFSPCNGSKGNVYVNVDGTRYDRQYYAIDTASDNTKAWNSSNSAFVPVSAGNHTVSLEVENLASSAGDTGVWSGGINVLFVAFGGDGTTPSSVETGAAPDPQQGQ